MSNGSRTSLIWSFMRDRPQINRFSLSLFRRPLLKQIKNSAESHIVLDCSTEKIYDVLKQAQQIGMMSDYHSYLITSLVRFSVNHVLVNSWFLFGIFRTSTLSTWTSSNTAERTLLVSDWSIRIHRWYKKCWNNGWVWKLCTLNKGGLSAALRGI